MIQATALDIIRLASKMAGTLAIGQTQQSEDATDCFTLLNSMIATWNQNRWLIYHLNDVSTKATGKISYSVGPGGDIDTPWPNRVQGAYVRLIPPPAGGSGPVDFALAPIETHEEYAQIRLKQLKSFPSDYFYESTFPQGTLFVWPIPSGEFEIHLILRDTLTDFSSLTTKFVFPPEYYEAVVYNLAGRISLLYQTPLNPGVIALARAGLNTIRVANHRVGNLVMPGGLSRVGGGWPAHGIPGIVEGTFRLDQDALGPV